MDVALVTVGDELLSGDTVNTNAAWLGEQLTNRGARVERATTVPDRVADIARIVNEYAAEYDAVIVTGGLGPTHDDRTIDSVAAAVGRELESNETALQWLATAGGYERGDLADGTADLPADARPLHNTVGVAPGCVVKNVYVLPGVPDEMKAMFERIEGEFSGQYRHAEFLVVDEPESALIGRFEELQKRFDVTVGSYPGDNVRVKIESADEERVKAAIEWLRERTESA
ncbi:MAG: molybdenum cofactor synthesis domain-containing protein [Natronomonas sp.]|jgi:molybdenum cofactor synthesis domain-containing protein|uniref:competence/damage-inducible protein A n=1 Tax=Natronomonas sp. TaxID=2184060 RepID=UPI003988B60D